MARLYTGRPKVLAAYRSYHGSTHASIHLTGDPRRWASDTGAAASSTVAACAASTANSAGSVAWPPDLP
jgi:4-aminobutyrate aminotransferase-like enzyme